MYEYKEAASEKHTASQTYLSTRGGDYGVCITILILVRLAFLFYR